MPDHLRNLYELENYQSKPRIRKERSDDREARKQSELKRNQDLVDQNIVPIIEDCVKSVSDIDHIKIGSKYLEDIFTRSGLKSRIINEANAYIKNSTPEEFKQFMKDNRFFLIFSAEHPEFDHTKCFITSDTYQNVCLNFYILRVRIYTRGKRDRDRIYYRDILLEYDNQSDYLCNSNRNYTSGWVIENLNKVAVGPNTRYTFQDHRREKFNFIRKRDI